LARASPPALTLHGTLHPAFHTASDRIFPPDQAIQTWISRRIRNRKNGFGEGQASEALEQQPQDAASDPMGRDDNNPRSFQRRNQYRSNRDRDHTEGEAGPPLAPNPVSVLQSRLNESCYGEIPGTYRGNQTARNQQQKIGASHVGEARPEQTEREDLVKGNVGSQ
jgi:hypothetical protein